jgi:hypothetical protein
MKLSATRAELDIKRIDETITKANLQILELIKLKAELEKRNNLKLIQGGSTDAKPF